MLLGYNKNLSENPQDMADSYVNGNIDPSAWQAAKSGFSSSFTSPVVLASDALEAAGVTDKTPNSFQEGYDVANQISNSASTLGGKAAGFIGNIAGTVADPLNWLPAEKAVSVVGNIGGKLLDFAPGVGKAVEDMLPTRIAEYLPGAFKSAALGAAINTQAAIPSEYDDINNKLNTEGLVSDAYTGAGLGILFHAGAFGIKLALERSGKTIDATEGEKAVAADPNPAVQVNDGLATVNLIDDEALKNSAAVNADTVVADGKPNSDAIRSTMASSISNVTEDAPLLNAVNSHLDSIEQVHNVVSKSIDVILDKEQESLGPVANSILGEDDAESLSKVTDPNDLGVLHGLDSYNDPDKSDELNRIRAIAKLRANLITYQTKLTGIKRLMTIQHEDISDATSSNNLLSYMKDAGDSITPPIEDSAPVDERVDVSPEEATPDTESQGEDNTSPSQNASDNIPENPLDKNLEEDDPLKRDEDSARETQKSIEENPSVFKQLYQCLLRNK